MNPFEIKAEISKIYSELEGINDVENYEIHFRRLDAENDASIICKLLFKEINNKNSKLTKFMLLRYCPSKELSEKLWGIIKNNLSSNQAKIFALDLLRDIDTDWSYEECDKYFDNPDELVAADTQKILDSAILNPEVQIDFLDFLTSLPEDDKIVLLNSLANDYSQEELANMLIPVFLSVPDGEVKRAALDILGNSKSQLAYHALTQAFENASDNLKPLINKNISTLKLTGIREDNSLEYYKNLLKESKPYRFCITYPDGHGNQAIIFSRISKNGKIQFVAIVIDDYKGIRDCFGFNEISKFECNAIIDKFYKGQRALEVEPSILRAILDKAEKLSNDSMPYEYACWKNLLSDIEPAAINLNYKIRKLNESEFEEILKYDFTDFWFLDSQYSDEFEEFLKVADSSKSKDFDKIINENVNKIFYPSEAKIWTNRILNVSLLKHLAGDEKAAEMLYSLHNDSELIKEMFKNILRKSLYEYYFAKKDDPKVKEIEVMWVNA